MIITDEKLSLLIALINAMSKKKSNLDDPDFSVYDYSGGNFDDAYAMGCSDGEISFAKELKNIIGKEAWLIIN